MAEVRGPLTFRLVLKGLQQLAKELVVEKRQEVVLLLVCFEGLVLVLVLREPNKARRSRPKFRKGKAAQDDKKQDSSL